MQEINMEMLGNVQCAGANSGSSGGGNTAGTNYNADGTQYNEPLDSTDGLAGLLWAAGRAVASPLGALFYAPPLGDGTMPYNPADYTQPGNFYIPGDGGAGLPKP